ncbi:MAG: hypothetical protein ACP5OG_05600 [Candidatus Nanoarchaeia archaeon]
MIKNKILIVFGIILAIIFSKAASAAHLGVSPASMIFDNVMRGGYAQKNLVVSLNSDKPLAISIDPKGDIADWINVSDKKFNMTSLRSVKISVNPPEDIPNGNYTGYLKILTEEFAPGETGQAVSYVLASLDLALTVIVTDIETRSCLASAYSVESAEKGEDIVFSLNVENLGNTRIKPKVRADIWDQEKISIVKTVEFSEEEIIPTTQEKLIFKTSSNDLDIGQYWVDISALDCYSSQTLTFDVLEEGALKENGVILGIVVDPWVDVSETTPILVNFKNIGEKGVNAQFKGKISSGDKITQILESDIQRVEINEETNFSFYFTPKQAGKYIVSGRVFYNKKRTFESSAVINVKSKIFSIRSYLMPLIYALVLFVLVVLFYKIRKQRKEYHERLKMIGRIK